MVFSSIIFLFYFLPLFFTLYYLVPVRFKNAIVLAGSILFYSWGGPVFIFVILLTTTLDFFLVRQMDKARNYRWVFLLLSVSVNLGLLFYYKYFHFFIFNLNEILVYSGFSPLENDTIIMPLGISFYTFEAISYVIDVYRREQKPLTRFWDLQLYILLFPKLIAGPIVRFSQISSQIHSRFSGDTVFKRTEGLFRFIMGLAKKVLIANVLGEFCGSVYNPELLGETNTAELWMAAFAYTFQIYFDFSGYSDMAIGLCLMMGFSIPENFNFPYISKSITEFWKRWHITLGSWMKTYIYIPLGGNKDGNFKLLRNLLLVFLISGLWHGASWNYVLWGLFHGIIMIAERIFCKKTRFRLPSFISVFFTFFFLVNAWVIFRIEETEYLRAVFTKMYDFADFNFYSREYEFKFIFILLLAVLLSFSGFWKPVYTFFQPGKISILNSAGIIAVSFFCLILLLLSLSSVVAGSFNPFIYFRF